jgi:hypothetical protein
VTFPPGGLRNRDTAAVLINVSGDGETRKGRTHVIVVLSAYTRGVIDSTEITHDNLKIVSVDRRVVGSEDDPSIEVTVGYSRRKSGFPANKAVGGYRIRGEMKPREAVA